MDSESSPSYAHGAEEWRAIPGHDGWYEVSDQGHVRSLMIGRWAVPRVQPLILRGTRHSAGYRHVSIRNGVRFVHRLVLEAFVGPCPADHEASHLNGQRADNRLVNLRWESRAENNRRKAEHGTLLFGGRHPFAIDPSRAVRGDAHGSRLHPERLARGERHGSRTHPERVPRGDGHSSRVHPERVLRGEATYQAKLTEADVRAVRAAAARGEPHTAIAARYGVAPSSIDAVVRRQSWKHVQ